MMRFSQTLATTALVAAVACGVGACSSSNSPSSAASSSTSPEVTSDDSQNTSFLSVIHANGDSNAGTATDDQPADPRELAPNQDYVEAGHHACSYLLQLEQTTNTAAAYDGAAFNLAEEQTEREISDNFTDSVGSKVGYPPEVVSAIVHGAIGNFCLQAAPPALRGEYL